MVARSDDLIQAFRATGCKPQQSPKRLKLRASEFRQLVPQSPTRAAAPKNHCAFGATVATTHQVVRRRNLEL